MSDTPNEIIKEAMDFIAFSDDIHEQSQKSILKKLKNLHPKIYQEWIKENNHLIEKWDIPAS